MVGEGRGEDSRGAVEAQREDAEKEKRRGEPGLVPGLFSCLAELGGGLGGFEYSGFAGEGFGELVEGVGACFAGGGFVGVSGIVAKQLRDCRDARANILHWHVHADTAGAADEDLLGRQRKLRGGEARRTLRA